MEQADPKTMKTRICRVYFKPILTYNSKIITFTKRKKGKIQAMYIKFLTNTEEKIRRDKIKNKIIRK
jgi:hypothetical protein